SPFEAPGKVVEVLNYAKPFVDALNSIPKAEVIAQPSWELYHMSPGEFDERLKWVNTIIFADVETKCLMLHPDFFTRAKWGDNPVTFPDRFDSLREWIEKGDTLNRLLDLRQRSEEHTSELQSRENLVCRLLLEKKKKITNE